MAGMFGGSRGNNLTPTVYTGISLQTSSSGMPIPIGWGQFRAGVNIIWLNNFKASASGGGKGGKGGGGKGGAKTYTYSTGVIMAICEGPIQGHSAMWSNGQGTNVVALGMTEFLGSSVQVPPSFISSTYPSQALSYADTAYLFASDLALGSSNTIPEISIEVVGTFSGSIVVLPDANMADIIPDFLTNARYGLDPSIAPYIDATTLADYHNYNLAALLWFSPYLHTQEQALTTLQRWAQLTNTFIFWSGTSLKFVPLATSLVISALATYTPNTTPLFSLTYDDFAFDPSSEDPITFSRVNPKDIQNRIEIDCLDRFNSYNTTPVNWEDSGLVSRYGLSQPNIIQATECCDTGAALRIAQLIGIRLASIRNTYTFKLGPNWFILEPGDIVEITDVNLGLTNFPIRLTQVEEDSDGLLHITAEQMPAGGGQAITYNAQANSASPGPDTFAAPGNVNPPAIFEPGTAYTNGQAEIWIGLSGGANWGGALVFASSDNVNYANVGEVTSKSAQGVTTTSLPTNVDPDVTHTLGIDLTESLTQLSTGTTHADADNFITACLIDTEVVAYGTIALTGTYAYNLTYLRRGVYGTTIASHTSGGQITRIDPGAVCVLTLPQQWIGQTLYFKFCSYNIFGKETQDISLVSAYTYVPQGPTFHIEPPTVIALNTTRNFQPDGSVLLGMDVMWTASIGPQVGSYEIQYSLDSGVTWTVDVSTGALATDFNLTPAVANTNYRARVRAISQNGYAVSAWSTSSVVNSGSSSTTVPSTPTGLAATPGNGTVSLIWNANASADAVQFYNVWRAVGTGAVFGSAVKIATVNALSFLDTGLAPGSGWTYFLTATNTAGTSTATAGVNAVVLTATSTWAPSMSLARLTEANEELFVIDMVYATALPINLTGSKGGCDIAATGTVNFDLRKNGSSIGTATIPSGTTGRSIATFTFASAVSFAIGDTFSMIAPASPDTTLKNFYFSFLGSR